MAVGVTAVGLARVACWLLSSPPCATQLYLRQLARLLRQLARLKWHIPCVKL